MQKLPLSACIIAKDEESMIRGCLDSLINVVSEIILVDTGSMDKTKEIAGLLGCRIIDKAWNNDFSEARNESLRHATQPFILYIDADERMLNPEILQEVINNAGEKAGGWLVEIISEAKRPDGIMDTYISNQLRLFRNKESFRFTGIIHEQIHESILSSGYNIVNTGVCLHHLGYSLTHEEMIRKQKRNLNLLNIALSHKPNDAYNLYQRAKTYLALGDLENAENDVSSAIDNAPPSGAVKPQALNFGSSIAFQRGDYSKARARAEESLRLVPNQAFANFLLGEVFSANKRFAEAYEAYKNIETARESPDFTAKIVGDYYISPEQLSYRLGKSLLGMKLYDNALKEFEKGFGYNPMDVSCIVGMANVAFHFRKFREAKELLVKAKSLNPGMKELDIFLEQVTKAMSQSEKPPIPGKRPLISLSMIVKNEEDMLPGCLESVKDVVDEIIIVDTGSTDGTMDIAMSFGARVIEFDWTDDFSAARNVSLSHCTGEWVLYLDADERLSQESKYIIRGIVQTVGYEVGGLICTLESDHRQLDGRTELHRGGYPRLFRNYGYPTIAFKGRVHEQITPSIQDLDKGFLFTDIIIEHLGYNQPREIMEQKIQRNYKMLIEHVKEEPLNGYAWFQLGQTLAQMKLLAEAEQTIRFAVQMGSLSNSVHASACATIAQLVGNQKKFAEALEWAEKSLEKAPTQVYALHLKAYALMYLDRFDEAEQCFHEVLKRMKSRKDVPLTGFDIVIPEEVVLKGISELSERRKGNLPPP